MGTSGTFTKKFELIIYSWLDPAQWQAKKVLGLGGYGLVGHWEYIGNDPNMPRNMAVKQSNARGYSAMARESKLLRLITSTGTAHVIKLYKAIFNAPGTGTTRTNLTKPTQDPLPFDSQGVYDEDLEVARMYLEFGTGGDMVDYENKLEPSNGPGADLKPPEEHIWRIFSCLAKALHVLEYGTDDAAARDPAWSKS